jgi:hypothetical protein
MSTGWLVEHLRSTPLKMPALKPQPPKAKLCQVTTPLAPLTLVRLSLVCRLWCRSWGSLRYSGGLSPHLGLRNRLATRRECIQSVLEVVRLGNPHWILRWSFGWLSENPIID